jgi:hypothetical protein
VYAAKLATRGITIRWLSRPTDRTYAFAALDLSSPSAG